MRTTSLLKPLAICLSGAMVAGLTFFTPVKKYVPRNENQKDATGFAGAADYYHWLKQDPATGKLNLNAMVEFQNEMLARFNGTSKIAVNPVINLAWEEMGPDNIGGRCRAIVVDRNNTSRLFAGGVSAGLFRSDNGGTNWYPINDQLATLVVSCITQDGDGNIYFGTGEGMARGGSGDGNSAFIGAGVYAMTYDATTDSYSAPTIISSTVPTPNSTSGNWVFVNRIATSPVKHNGNYYIYAATNQGLYVSTDNGGTWTSALPIANRFTFDVDVCNDGTVYATAGLGVYTGTNKVYRSVATDFGQPGTFTDITPPTSVLSWASMGRIEIAASKSNSNVVYISVAKPLNPAATLAGVYQSVNSGTSWTSLAVGNVNFEPFATYGQGDYDHVLEVFPDNDYEILLGGVDMFIWKAATGSTSIGQWDQFSDQFYHPFNYSYMHADKHAITFHPTDPNTVYFGTDGGVFRSTNRGSTFSAMNKGFNATQFYAVAAERDALWSYGTNYGTYNGAGVFGGTQDNGTPYISGNLNTVKSGESINGGDGFYVEASMLSPNTFFYTSYYGLLERTSNRSAQGADFYPGDRTTLLACGNTAVPGDGAFAAFNTPIALWESPNVSGVDSVEFVVDSIVIPSVMLANGTQNSFTFTITKPQTAAIITGSSIKVIAGTQTVTFSDGVNADAPASGTYDQVTDQIQGLQFPTLPAANTPIKVVAAISYAAGSQLLITSASLNAKFFYTLPNTLVPGDTINIMDPIQARLAVGLTGTIYLNKNPLNFSDPANWVKIAGNYSTTSLGVVSPLAGTVTTLEFGGINYLYAASYNYSTGDAYLYRVSGLGQVIDKEQDIDSFSVASSAWVCARNKTSPIKCDRIGTFTNRSITSISVDPSNPDRIVVTLGNYGATNHVYYCANATTAPAASGTTNFTQVSTISSPVYSSTFVQTSYGEANPNNVLIGTETGVYSIDLSNTAAGWQTEGSDPTGLFPNVPTFMLRQQTWGSWECYNSGIIYAATHGRGIWQSKKFHSPFIVGMNEQESAINNVSTKAIKAFPNPANDFTTVNFILGDERRISISVYDLKGSKLKTVNCGKMQKGSQNINVELNGLAEGTYIIAVSDDSNVIGTCRFIKVK